VKQNIGVLPFQQPSIPLEVARIGTKVFFGTELRRVHENGDNDAIAPLLPIARETQVRIVKKTHGGNQDDAFSSVTLGVTPLLHLLNVLNDLHRKHLGVGILEYWNIEGFCPLFHHSSIPFPHP
jgi:hypothetical protein